MNKLLKYEALAVGRVLVPVWLGAFALCLLATGINALQSALPAATHLTVVMILQVVVELLAALLLSETEALPENWEQQPSACMAVLMRAIGLHSALLGMIGDQTEGISGEKLNDICWLTTDQYEKIAQPLQDSQLSPTELEKKSASATVQAAETAAGYFLSKNGVLVRECGGISVEEILKRLNSQQTPQEIWEELCGGEIQIETVKNP